VLAFDAKTGAPLWRSKALAGSTRSDLASPVSGIFHGRKQVIWPTGEQLAAVAPEDGSVLWQFDYKQAFGLDDLGQSHSNMKPAIHGDLVIDNLWNHKPTNRTFAVRVTEDGPVLAWDTQTLASWYHPVIAWKDMLIGLDNQGIPGSTGPACKGTRPPEIGMLQCYDIQTGEMLWNTNKFDPTMPEQLLHRSRHSFIIVNDKMIIQSPRGGVAFVDIERSGSHVFGSFDTEQRGPGYSQPAFSNGQLFIRRANGPLSCYELGKD
jgi:hypothetical protein